MLPTPGLGGLDGTASSMAMAVAGGTATGGAATGGAAATTKGVCHCYF